MVFMPPRHGKFLEGNTPVLTTSGWKTHASINVGDFVFDSFMNPVRVLANSGVYKWGVNKVVFDCGETILAADEHLWQLNNGKVLSTKEIGTNFSAEKSTITRLQVGAEKDFKIKKITRFCEVLGNCIEVEGGVYLVGKSMIPTHNSELTSRRLPAYMFGINPNVKIVGCSYNTVFARDFNRDIQRIIMSERYADVFPNITLNEKNVATDAKGGFKRNADEFEIVGYEGKYVGVGIGGPLTGRDMHIGIIDDPVKDAEDGESLVQQMAKWEWYTKVFLSREEANTQQLITQTRWAKGDLSGRILAEFQAKFNDWVIISLPAIKKGETHPRDPRKEGEPLWPAKKSLAQLKQIEDVDPRGFHALYQQDPKPFKGGLCYPEWHSINLDEFEKINVEEIGGLDFGYTNPSCFLKVKITEDSIYVDEQFYKKKLTNSLITEELDRLEIDPYMEIIADSSEPKSIEDIYIDNYNVHPVRKFAGSIRYGIKKINRYKLFITRRSTNVIREIKNYRWKSDKEGNPLEDPIKKNDHAMDAMRYAVMGSDNITSGIIELPIGSG